MHVDCPGCKTRCLLEERESGEAPEVRCDGCGRVFSPETPAQPKVEGTSLQTPRRPDGRDETHPEASHPPREGEDESFQQKGSAKERMVGGRGETALPPDGPPDPKDTGSTKGETHSSRAVGLSAIRAQSLRADSSARAVEEAEQPLDRTGWQARVRGTADTHFRDLESVRAWMAANPGADILLSSDGVEWCRPEEIMGVSLPAGDALARTDDEGTTTTGVAQKAGPVWTATAMLSTVLMVCMLAVTAQNLRLVDLEGIVPFEKLGLKGLLWSSVIEEPEEEARPPSPDDLYLAAVRQGDAAREKGRLIDAALAYELALEAREGRYALEGLMTVYEELGDRERARDAEQRLSALGVDEDPLLPNTEE